VLVGKNSRCAESLLVGWVVNGHGYLIAHIFFVIG